MAKKQPWYQQPWFHEALVTFTADQPVDPKQVRRLIAPLKFPCLVKGSIELDDVTTPADGIYTVLFTATREVTLREVEQAFATVVGAGDSPVTGALVLSCNGEPGDPAYLL